MNTLEETSQQTEIGLTGILTFNYPLSFFNALLKYLAHFDFDGKLHADQWEAFFTRAKSRSLKRIAMAIYREHLLNAETSNKADAINALIFPSKISNEALCFDNVEHYSLKRILIKGNIFITKNNDEQTLIEDPIQLLRWLKKENQRIEPEYWNQFLKEVKNSTENEALMLAYHEFWKKTITKNIQQDNKNSLWQWLLTTKNQYDILSFFEQWGAMGHPYHPCSKTKLGLNHDEVLKYSPEFQATVNIKLAAIHKSISEFELIKCEQGDINDLIAKYFPVEFKAWSLGLKSLGVSPDNYYFLLIHPWQAEYIIPDKFLHLLNEQQLIILENVKLNSTPSMSFRTMIPLSSSENKMGPHIKLPTAIHTTSVMRTVSPESVKTGPRLSSVLQKILNSEKEITQNLSIASDLGGVFVDPISASRYDDVRHLSYLLRQNPISLLQKDEIALALASVFSPSANMSQPLLCEILDAAHIKTKAEILHYFSGYCKTVLTACLDLYLIYGIALEAHQQNTLLVFKNNKPVKLIVRDLGGIRVHLPTLEEAEIKLPKDTFSLTFTDSNKVARAKFIHATLYSNLSDWLMVLHKQYNIPEITLWEIILKNIQDRFEYLKDRISSERWHTEHAAILKNKWPLKALIRMRLNEKIDNDKDYMQGNIYINIDNPFD